MRYLVLSDLHANLEALEACLAHSATKGFDHVLVLGDLVGYGADPNAVIDRVQALAPTIVIRGNHDKAAVDLAEAEEFNPTARQAARWTFEAITEDRRAWLAALPRGPHAVDDLLEICHGSPDDEDAYVFDVTDAASALREVERPVCLFGHTHVPAVFYRGAGRTVQVTEGTTEEDHPPPGDESRISIEPGVRYLLNPGSVGQPRDGIALAACAIADTERRRVDLFRVSYDVQRAQQKILAAGLPEILARRLALGR